MSSPRMELTGLHGDIGEPGPFTQIRDANNPWRVCESTHLLSPP